MFRENVVFLSSDSFDIGNTGANVDILAIPTDCRVRKVVCIPLANATANFTVSVDTYNDDTQGAADLASILVPASAVGGNGYFDKVAEGTKLTGGTALLIQVDDAGDSGDTAIVGIELEYSSETEANQVDLIETA